MNVPVKPKVILFVLALMSWLPVSYAQNNLRITADKNFYLLSTLQTSKALPNLIGADPTFNAIQQQKVARLTGNQSPTELLAAFKWTAADSAAISRAFAGLYHHHTRAFDQLINARLRPSGRYERFKNLDNADFLLSAWAQCVVGMNIIIDRYGFGKNFRYPAIDSASYNVRSKDYEVTITGLLSYMRERIGPRPLFYQPTLSVALQLLVLNKRDEAARFEPLEKGENRAAKQKAHVTRWKDYPYSAILVPGEGLEAGMRGISPLGQMRCDLAADRYRRRMAPFIIVSGGFVHPLQTAYCEAYEMKKYLVVECHIPASAIVIEPQARHTTTNFRNSERLMIRYGFPLAQPALCVTTKDQADYIEKSGFDRRNLKELGYLPYRDKQRLSDHETSFKVARESLHMDPIDPLDP